MALPNFLIVGAMKAGTSTLRDYLREHEDVFMYPGEVHFFNVEANYRRGLDWYERHFDDAEGESAIGEKTPTYCYLPEVAERISKALPDVKLIWLFRDPVDRALSNYWYNVSKGYERLSFEAAIHEELAGKPRDVFMLYLKRGEYREQVARYLEHFPRDRMLFLTLEELACDPQSVLDQTLAFLEIDSRFPFRSPRRSNVTWIPRSRHAQYTAVRLGLDKVRLAWRALNKLNRRPEPGYPALPADLRKELDAYYRGPNADLERLTGVDLSIWERQLEGCEALG